jgi:hypothetical protein
MRRNDSYCMPPVEFNRWRGEEAGRLSVGVLERGVAAHLGFGRIIVLHYRSSTLYQIIFLKR